MAETSLIIGIDTGGTYTDAVVIDADLHRILAKAKAITTKGDLAIGVSEALRMAIAGVDGFAPASVRMVSISTTLATNAIVEGHGSAAALALIGFDAAMEERSGLGAAFGSMPIMRFAGGHDHAGRAIENLDEEALRNWVKTVAPDVTAFAVAASFATRNAEHELRAADIIAAEARKPVTLSHQLADTLDAPRRAQTAVLNARLVSRVTGLVAAVRRAMAGLELSCPLMLMKGDGSLALADVVAGRPIETVLSGPAASLIGAQWLSGLDDFIMADMGGTTTDVGLLRGGNPRLADQGAEVGTWRTMVKAIDLKTIGLGGDSEVHIEPARALRLGPQRVVPLSLMAWRAPELLALLEADLAQTAGGALLGKFVVLPFGAITQNHTNSLTLREAELLSQISDKPVALRRLASGSAGLRTISNLREKGLVQICAFSPSDAAHVLKLQDNWSREAAVLAAKLSARFATGKVVDDVQLNLFCLDVWDLAVRGTVRVILEAGFGIGVDGPLVEAVAKGHGQLGQIKIQLSPTLPIVAVGGPVKVYYPEAAKRLGCEVVFTSHYDVANAIGAAAALVACRVVLRLDGDGTGMFRLTGSGVPANFGSATGAIKAAEQWGRAGVLAMAALQGALKPKVKLTWIKQFMPDAKNDDGLLTAELVAEARGLAV